MILEFIFWVLIGAIIYSFLGYTLILIIIRFFIKQKPIFSLKELPSVTLFVAAYNEKEIIEEKLANSNALDYPKDKLIHLWVTDGSTDGTNLILQNSENVKVLHEEQRNGKIGAINRGMEFVTTPIVIFTDANTLLQPESINQIVYQFSDPQTGCVTGEKRIQKLKSENAVGSGEGIYWKYESFIKRLESDIGSTISAAGEIFAIRTDLFNKIEPDTIIEDFVISLGIAARGYKIKYAPKAVGIENSSASIKEELKRKVRIAAGSMQTLIRMKTLLNIFKYRMLTFQYISHKVLRWTLLPFAMILSFILNIVIVINSQLFMYKYILLVQIIFYFIALIGLVFRNMKARFHFIFVPYYIVTMNYAILLGIFRFANGKQSINWEKAKRR
jgi:cellulose synthase/poly-beta-1,6-N-acetylglucosamine synthase-like glycosyltransferase